jgi:hypothetical protein
VYTHAYQHFFLILKIVSSENKEQDTVRFIGVSEKHSTSFFNVDDSSTKKMEAVRFSLVSNFLKRLYVIIFQ